MTDTESSDDEIEQPWNGVPDEYDETTTESEKMASAVKSCADKRREVLNICRMIKDTHLM